MTRGLQRSLPPAAKEKLRGEFHSSMGRRRSSSLFVDDDGFTTVSMALSMVLALALVMSAAQVYRLQSRAASIQEVADAAALASENVVAEYMIAVRVCDALALSLSLLGLTTTGVAVVALCLPLTQPLGSSLLEAADRIIDARNRFTQSASEGLTKLQGALPYLACANAALVAAHNNGNGSSFMSCAVLVPAQAEAVTLAADDQTPAVYQAADEAEDELSETANKADEALKEANEAKQQGFLFDCGNEPGPSMRERAQTLAGLTGADNPDYSSVDAWSFSVALQRAQTYYRTRAAQETPLDSTIREQGNSRLRSHFFQYAVSEMARGYVHETEDSFDAYFPRLPKNNEEMSKTSLYDLVIFPVTIHSDGSLTAHSFSNCPNARLASGLSSMRSLSGGTYKRCEECGFLPSDFGKIAAASTSIDNGFEYSYVRVAEAAEAYEKARHQYEAHSREVKRLSGSLLDKVKEAIKVMAGQRIDVTPPGSKGALAMVCDMATPAADEGLASNFVTSVGSLRQRVAVSGATLIEEPAGETGTVVSALLDGFGEDAGMFVGAGRVVLGAWSALLRTYTEGPRALGDALDTALGEVSFGTLNGLGSWAAERLTGGLEDLGLAPPDLDSLKPVLVNSGRVAASDDGPFAARYLTIKSGALSVTQPGGSVFAGLLDEVQTQADSLLERAGQGIEVACITVPFVEIEIPIVLALPPALTEGAQGFITQAVANLRSLVDGVVQGRRWE